MDDLQLIPQLQEVLLRRQIPFPSWDAEAADRQTFQYAILRVLAEEEAIFRIPREQLPPIAARLARTLLGLGVLEPFLREDAVEEIIVRDGLTQIERDGRIEDHGRLATDDYFLALAQRVAEFGGKPLRAANPFVLVDLPDGSRFTAMIPPLSRQGTAINIRVFAERVWTLEDLLVRDALTATQAACLRDLVGAGRASLLISGRPGAGKTTLLNTLLALLPDAIQLCIAETFEELRVARRVARAIVREEVEEGKVTMRQVVNVLYTRMRPDVLVVGEVVADEAREFLQAMNLGVVALATIHGNSALDALLRLESLAVSERLPLAAARERIARGIQVVVHIEKDRAGRRRVAEIARVEGLRDGGYALVQVGNGEATSC